MKKGTKNKKWWWCLHEYDISEEFLHLWILWILNVNKFRYGKCEFVKYPKDLDNFWIKFPAESHPVIKNN